MKKQIMILAMVVFMVGIVVATGMITNVSELVISDFVAGGSATAKFGFDYPDVSEIYPHQEEDAPLMIKVDVVSEDSENYPVWKGDFDLGGSMVNYGRWFFPNREYFFDCYEDDFVYYYGGVAQVMSGIPAGTFYCYNPGFSAMRIGSSSDVVLNIGSDMALWPGVYDVSVGLYYPQEEYINVEVTSVNSHAVVNQNSTLEFNLSFEISGGNAVRMKMSDFVDGVVVDDGIGFVIGDGVNYSVEELNARIVYDGVEYAVGNDYNYSQDAIVFDIDKDWIARGVAVFKMDIKDYMEPGNYHGTYQFNVTQEI